MNVLYGYDKKDITAWLMHRVNEKIRAKQDGTVIIVPEQYSFDAERMLCTYCGNTVSRYAQILSFSRLLYRVSCLYGGVCRKILNGETKLIALAMALEQIESELRVFSSSRQNPDELLAISEEIASLKSAGIRWTQLRAAAAALEGSTAQKLQELSLILETYDMVCEKSGADPTDSLYYLSNLLWENEFSNGREFLIDGFSDFTAPQFDVLRTLISKRAEITIGFVCDNPESGNAIFHSTRECISKLRTLCKSFGIPFQLTCVNQPASQNRYALHRSLLREEIISDTTAAIVSCEDLPSECEQVVATIRTLFQNGARYRDITIACPDKQRCLPYLLPALSAAGLPVYWANRHMLSQEPTVQALLDVLQACLSGYPFEIMLHYIKSPLSGLSGSDAAALSLYASCWEIHGNRWEKDWDMSPGGLGETLKSHDETALKELNKLRKKVITPLKKLRTDFKKSLDAAECANSVCSYLNHIGFPGILEKLSQEPAVSEKRAQELSQIVSALEQILTQLSLLLNGSACTADDFVRYFRGMTDQHELKTVPAGIDSVLVDDFSGLRFKMSRHLLVIDADNNSAIQANAPKSILSEDDRIAMRKLPELVPLPLAPDYLNRSNLSVYSLLSSWSKSLTLFQKAGISSILCSKIAAACPRHITIQADKAAAINAETAISTLSDAQLSDLTSLLNPDAAVKLKNLNEIVQAAVRYQPEQPSESIPSNYPPDIDDYSATKISSFFKCPAQYYYQCILQLRRENSLDFGNSVKGILVHRVLEILLSGEMMPDCSINDIVNHAIQTAVSELLPDWCMESNRFVFLLNQAVHEVHRFALQILEELSRSDFAPSFLEHRIQDQQYLSGVTITGSVDRIDTCLLDGHLYFRVIDYKTGHAPDAYSDVIAGTGLQPLIYLFSVVGNFPSTETTDNSNPPAVAGYLYNQLSKPLITQKNPSKESASSGPHSGMILNSKAVLDAMYHANGDQSALPVTFDEAGNPIGDLASAREFNLLNTFVKSKLDYMQKQIHCGSFAASPLDEKASDGGPCRYCSYASLCEQISPNPEHRVRTKYNKDDFWREVSAQQNIEEL